MSLTESTQRTSRGNIRHFNRSSVVFLCCLAWGQMSHAATIDWSGILRLVLDDSGLGTYSGGIEDSTEFSGSFTYNDSCGAGCLVEPFGPEETNYVFAGGSGSLVGLGITTNGVESSVNVVNNQMVDADSSALFGALGATVPTGSSIDVWTVASENADDVIEWEISYIYTSSDPFANTNYTATPPADPDLLIFSIDDGDEIDYFALGEVTVVPIPAAVWLFASALGIVGFRRRKVA